MKRGNMIMKINTFKYFFKDAMNSLKRNFTITIASVITVAAALFIVGLFFLYMMSVDKNSATEFVFSCIFNLILHTIIHERGDSHGK